MKTESKQEKEFDTVKTFPEIKEKISREIQGMNYGQFKAYLAERKLKSQKH